MNPYQITKGKVASQTGQRAQKLLKYYEVKGGEKG